jgi:hypothetical protein
MSQDEKQTKIAAADAGKSEQTDATASTLAGIPELAPATLGGTVIGEGSYEGTRDYAASIDSYMRNADIDDAVQAAAPTSASEEGDLLRAEAEGASRTKAPGE